MNLELCECPCVHLTRFRLLVQKQSATVKAHTCALSGHSPLNSTRNKFHWLKNYSHYLTNSRPIQLHSFHFTHLNQPLKNITTLLHYSHIPNTHKITEYMVPQRLVLWQGFAIILYIVLSLIKTMILEPYNIRRNYSLLALILKKFINELWTLYMYVVHSWVTPLEAYQLYVAQTRSCRKRCSRIISSVIKPA